MEKEEKNIQDEKRAIIKRLKSSNKKKWDALTPEEQEAVVNKYYSLRSIDHLGIDKVLENNWNLRGNFAFLILGIIFGIVGNLFGDILFKYLPENNLLYDIFICISFLLLLWWLIVREIDNFAADHLGGWGALEYLLKLVEEDNEDIKK